MSTGPSKYVLLPNEEVVAERMQEERVQERVQRAREEGIPMPVLFVATPCYGCQLTTQFAASILQLHDVLMRVGVLAYFDFLGNESLIERARNLQTARFLQLTQFTHMLFIDADIGFDPVAVLRLLQFNKDVSSAVYAKKGINWTNIQNKARARDPENVRQAGLDFNINLRRIEAPTNGFVRVLDTATGFLLIKRRVIERMYEHYKEELFAVNDVQPRDIKTYVALFACMIDPESKRFLSEDYAFCRRWQQIGGEIWVDTATRLSHLGTFIFRGDLRQRLPKKHTLITVDP